MAVFRTHSLMRAQRSRSRAPSIKNHKWRVKGTPCSQSRPSHALISWGPSARAQEPRPLRTTKDVWRAPRAARAGLRTHSLMRAQRSRARAPSIRTTNDVWRAPRAARAGLRMHSLMRAQRSRARAPSIILRMSPGARGDGRIVPDGGARGAPPSAPRTRSPSWAPGRLAWRWRGRLCRRRLRARGRRRREYFNRVKVFSLHDPARLSVTGRAGSAPPLPSRSRSGHGRAGSANLHSSSLHWQGTAVQGNETSISPSRLDRATAVQGSASH